MLLHVKRYGSEREPLETTQSYEVVESDATLLEYLIAIKNTQDATLAFSHECRSSVCGSCAVRVNGREELACAYKPKEGDLIEPLRNMPLLRDLVVDMERALTCNARAKAYGVESGAFVPVTPANVKNNALQSDCILCGSCYSACPVYSVNAEFLGPFALTRVWRYVSDVREGDVKGKIEAVQSSGVWDCTLCNECVPVCPSGIAPKQDIVMLRNKSGMMGFMDPNMFGGGGFGFGGAPDFGAPSF